MNLRQFGSLAAIGCAAFGVAPAATPPQSAPVAATTLVTVGDSNLVSDSLTALVRPLLASVESLRGHPFQRPVPVKVVDDSVAQVYFRARLATELPMERMRAEAVAYTHLGLLPPGTDLEKLFLDLMEEQAGGYYAPEHDAFYILSDMPPGVLPIIAVHELTHALDDQYFDIDGTLKRLENDADRESAYACVVEGSGTWVMAVFAAQEMIAGRLGIAVLQEFASTDAARAEKLMAAPPAVRRDLLAHYLLGSVFLVRGDPSKAGAGVVPEDLDRAFRDPPTSTEQILHPEKYWDPAQRDAPLELARVDLAATLGAGWGQIGTGTLGELLLGLMVGAQDPPLETAMLATPDTWTVPAAAGWGGDRWSVYEKDATTACVLATRWDREADAIEFEAALQLPAGGRAWRRGDAVVVVAGAPADRAEAVAAACLDSLTGGSPAGSKRP